MAGGTPRGPFMGVVKPVCGDVLDCCICYLPPGHDEPHFCTTCTRDWQARAAMAGTGEGGDDGVTTPWDLARVQQEEGK
jgi:hypothetical protein